MRAPPLALVHQIDVNPCSLQPHVPSHNPFAAPYRPVMGRAGIPLMGPLELCGVVPPMSVRVVELDEEPVATGAFVPVDDEMVREDEHRAGDERHLGGEGQDQQVAQPGRQIPPRARPTRPPPPPPSHSMRTRSKSKQALGR